MSGELVMRHVTGAYMRHQTTYMRHQTLSITYVYKKKVGCR